MKRAGAICPKCQSTRNTKEKINGQDTMDLICLDCKHIGWWKDFQPKDEQGDENK